MKRQTLFALFALLATPVATASPAFAEPVYVGVDGGNIAVSGYDAVSYFEGDGVPVKGRAEFSVEHDGAVYHFASAEHAARFAADPVAFKPQYGGHCSWAMSRNYLASGDPLQHAIVSGRLYLNYNAAVKAKWDKERAGFIAAGDKNWAVIPADARIGDE